jgi:hypothetical protein
LLFNIFFSPSPQKYTSILQNSSKWAVISFKCQLPDQLHLMTVACFLKGLFFNMLPASCELALSSIFHLLKDQKQRICLT